MFLLLLLVLQGGKLFLIIVYPNSRSTEVRARCCIRGVPQLAAANRLDLEELLSFDRETGSSSSMLGSSSECRSRWWVGVLGAGAAGQTEAALRANRCVHTRAASRTQEGGLPRARVPRTA